MASPPEYLSGTSANALISDLRPTTVTPQALLYINLFLDEILSSLIVSAESLNPKDLRTAGVPAVFSGDKAADSTGPRALGRAAVSEAELELRSWYDSHGGQGKGFPPSGSGNGMKTQKPFAREEAVEIMRVKGVTLCTLAPDDPVSKKWEDDALAAWKNAGGDGSDATLEPAGLWITAVIEHVCEHVLASMSRVVARDSSIAAASVQDLYTALCEDESVWGFFRRMAVKELLENAAHAGDRHKKANGTSGLDPAGRSSPAHNSSAYASRTSLALPGAETIRRGVSPANYNDMSSRGSSETSRLAPASASMSRSTSGLRQSVTGERSPSVLSAGTKSMIGAAYEELDVGDDAAAARGRQQDEEDEFDALVRSGQTMKVSLTPSRLKTFDSARRPAPDPPAAGALSSAEAKRDKRYQDAQQQNIGSGLRTPPRGGVRPEIGARTRSASSAQKMMARGATTIEEADEEDGAQALNKKQSLRDVFAEAQVQQGSPSKRTVPAVVLGAPPPPPPADSKPPTPRHTPTVSASNGTVPAAQDTEEVLRPKRRTEAQEMADFFASTGPSGDAGSIRSQDDINSSKPKGLKGFMAKMTGSKKDGKSSKSDSAKLHRSTPPISAPFPQGTQPSSASMLPLGPPVTAGDGSAPPVPPAKNALRTQPDARESAGTATTAAAVGAAGAAGVAVAGAAAYAGANPGVRRSLSSSKARKPAPKYIEDANSSVPSSSAASPSLSGPIDSVPEADELRAGTADTTDSTKADINSVPEATSTIDALSPVTERSHDGDSFATADEGVTPVTAQFPEAAAEPTEPSGAALGPRGSVSTVVQRSPAQKAGAVPPTDEKSSDSAPQAVPSIPLSHLLPLRTLLEHATTPQECNLLLNSILTEWGVPAAASAEEQASPKQPEDRVAAWLLAGTEAPAQETISS